MKELRVLKGITRLENASALDQSVDGLREVVHRVIQPQSVRDVLHGVPVGHPVHPLAVLVPAGAWVSSAVLDVMPGTAQASRVLVAFGVISAIPAALAGYTDWSELHRQQARVGLVHAAGNVAAIALYTASYIQRRRGREFSGKVLGYLGLACISGSGYLGGHLAYRQASGANHAEQVPHRFPAGWQRLAELDTIPEHQLTTMEVAGQPLLVLRRGQSVDVLSNVCTHLAGPLASGELIDGETDNPCVACPWHGSVFELRTGEVVHGPATAPQHRFESRVVEGVVEVRLPNAVESEYPVTATV